MIIEIIVSIIKLIDIKDQMNTAIIKFATNILSISIHELFIYC